MKICNYLKLTIAVTISLQPITVAAHAASQHIKQHGVLFAGSLENAHPYQYAYNEIPQPNLTGTLKNNSNRDKQSAEATERKKEDNATVRANLLAWVTHILTERYDYEKECEEVPLFIRGDKESKKLTIPLLENHRKIIAGTRVFHLRWQGGKSPYRVRISREYERHPFIERDSIQGHDLRLENFSLSPGNYTLKINDTEHSKIRVEFTVVPGKTVPPMPAEIKGSDLSHAAKATVYATWLASQQGGTWIFESFQRVAGMSDNYQPAHLLSNLLADGQDLGPIRKVTVPIQNSIKW